MKKIFLDTFYLQALADYQDNAHQKALEMTNTLGGFPSVTSEMVLTELLNALCGRGEYLRQARLSIVDGLQQNKNVEIIPQTPQLFAEALAFIVKEKIKVMA